MHLAPVVVKQPSLRLRLAVRALAREPGRRRRRCQGPRSWRYSTTARQQPFGQYWPSPQSVAALAGGLAVRALVGRCTRPAGRPRSGPGTGCSRAGSQSAEPHSVFLVQVRHVVRIVRARPGCSPATTPGWSGCRSTRRCRSHTVQQPKQSQPGGVSAPQSSMHVRGVCWSAQSGVRVEVLADRARRRRRRPSRQQTWMSQPSSPAPLLPSKKQSCLTASHVVARDAGREAALVVVGGAGALGIEAVDQAVASSSTQLLHWASPAVHAPPKPPSNG